MRRPVLSEVHAEIERLIELAADTADLGTRTWYERQASRWEANRPRGVMLQKASSLGKTEELARAVVRESARGQRLIR